MDPALLLFLAANYTTYLGGSKADTPTAITVDYAGAIYVAGTTSSPNFPVTSTTLGSPAAGHTCGFITKLNPEGAAPEFSVPARPEHHWLHHGPQRGHLPGRN